MPPLRLIANANLSSLDPIWTTALVAPGIKDIVKAMFPLFCGVRWEVAAC